MVLLMVADAPPFPQRYRQLIVLKKMAATFVSLQVTDLSHCLYPISSSSTLNIWNAEIKFGLNASNQRLDRKRERERERWSGAIAVEPAVV